jgi:glutaredoxin 2
MITVEFYNGKNLVGEAKIYNDELQMPETSFLNEKNQSAGEFVMQVKHTIELRRKAVATIARLRKEISASGNGMISLDVFLYFRMTAE